MLKKFFGMNLVGVFVVLSASWGWGAPTVPTNIAKQASLKLVSLRSLALDEIANRLNTDMETLDRRVPAYADKMRQKQLTLPAVKLIAPLVQKSPPQGFVGRMAGGFGGFMNLFKTPASAPKKVAPEPTVSDRDRTEITLAILDIVAVSKQITASQLAMQVGGSAGPYLTEVATRALLYALWADTVLFTGSFGGRINPGSSLFSDHDGWTHDRDLPDLLAGKLPLKASLSLLDNQRLADRKFANDAEQKAVWKASYTYFFSQHDLLWWDYAFTRSFNDIARLMSGAEPALFKTFYKYMLVQMFIAHDGARSDTHEPWSSRLLLYKDNGGGRDFTTGRDIFIPPASVTATGGSRYLFQTVGSLYNTNGFGVYFLNPYFRLAKSAVDFIPRLASSTPDTNDVIALRMLDRMGQPTPCSDLTDLGLPPSMGATPTADAGTPSAGGITSRCGGRGTNGSSPGGPTSAPNLLGNQLMMGDCMSSPLPSLAGALASGASGGGSRQCSNFDGMTLSAAVGSVRAADPSCVNPVGDGPEDGSAPPAPPPPSSGSGGSGGGSGGSGGSSGGAGGSGSAGGSAGAGGTTPPTAAEAAAAAIDRERAAEAALEQAETNAVNAILYTERDDPERDATELALLEANNEFEEAAAEVDRTKAELARARGGGGSGGLCADESCASSSCSRVDQQSLAFNGCNPTSSSATDTGTFCPDGGMCAGMAGSGSCGNQLSDSTNPACDPMIAASSGMDTTGCGSSSSSSAAAIQPITRDRMHEFINRYGNPGPEGGAMPGVPGGGVSVPPVNGPDQ